MIENETCDWIYKDLAWRSDCGGEFALGLDHGYVYCPKCGLEIQEEEAPPAA